jgi:hypothetical protein
VYWFVTDDSNRPPKDGQFFIYGGLIIPGDSIPLIHQAVEAIRQKYGYRAGDAFKFNTESKPVDVSEDAAALAKAEVLKMLEAQNAFFIATPVLSHVIARTKKRGKSVLDMDTATFFALNQLTAAFHSFLASKERNTWGAMFIDRDLNLLNHLSDIFQKGIKPEGYPHAVDDRIHSFALLSNNASHLSSVADIAVGAFRYMVNAATVGGDEETAVKLMKLLEPIILSGNAGNGLTRR